MNQLDLGNALNPCINTLYRAPINSTNNLNHIATNISSFLSDDIIDSFLPRVGSRDQYDIKY